MLLFLDVTTSWRSANTHICLFFNIFCSMETIITDPERNYILKVPTHGTGRISKKPFSIASPAMWNKLLTDELWSCTRIYVLKNIKIIFQYSFLKVFWYNFISLLSTCMFSLLLFFCKHPWLTLKGPSIFTVFQVGVDFKLLICM